MMCPYCSVSYEEGETCFCLPPMPRAAATTATVAAVSHEQAGESFATVQRKRFRTARRVLTPPLVARAAEAAIVAAVPSGRLAHRHA